MGSAMARVLFDLERPTVGLLNIGVEEVKGQEEVREAGRILREANLPFLDYVGFVEGDDIGKGTVDVVVTEGFAGNIAIKTAEGTARQIGEYLRAAMSRTLRAPDRLSAGARGVPDAARQDGPAQGEWRRVPRAQRHRHQEPRRNRRGRLCGRGRCRLRHGPLRTAQQDPRHARPPRPRGGRGQQSAKPLRDCHTFRRPRLRQLSAAAHPHQCRAVADGRHLRRMDRAAHRHPRAPHRGRRRDSPPTSAIAAARAALANAGVDRADRSI